MLPEVTGLRPDSLSPPPRMQLLPGALSVCPSVCKPTGANCLVISANSFLRVPRTNLESALWFRNKGHIINVNLQFSRAVFLTQGTTVIPKYNLRKLLPFYLIFINFILK